MIRIAGYVALFLAIFLATVYLRFPYAAVARHELATLNLPDELAIDFATLGPYGLGVSGTDLRVDRRSVDGAPLFAASHFRVGGLVRSATGPVDLDARFHAYGGDLYTTIAAREGGGYQIEVTGKELSLAALVAPLDDRLKGLRGAIGGTITFAGDPTRWVDGDGKVEINGGPGVISGVTFFGQTLPDVPFEHLVARMDLDKGVLRIDEAAISGTDLAASVDGRIRLRTPLPQSFVDLNCKVSLPPAVMAALQGFSDLASTYKQDDGSYQLQVKGTFIRPRLR